MLRRFVVGLLKGGVLGGAIAALVMFGLGVTSLTGFLAYLSVMLTGVFVALVAGNPVWARGAWVEVLLKGVAAAALSAGLLYAMQRYLPAGAALGAPALSQAPLFLLPTIATLLAMFFEVDNDPAEEVPGTSSDSGRVRVDEDTSAEHAESADLEEHAEPTSRQARR